MFPKNGSVEEQSKTLSLTSFGIAVGTPHRLVALSSSTNATATDQNKNHDDDDNNNNHNNKQQEKPSSASLLDQTKLIVFDCDVSSKQYTVCTLPDTAPSNVIFVRDCIIPQLQQRQDLHLAFF